MERISADASTDLGFALVPAERNLVGVERPRAEHHFAFLLVEREILHVDDARALVDGNRNPENLARVLDHDVWLVGHFVVAVGAVHTTVYSPLRNEHGK